MAFWELLPRFSFFRSFFLQLKSGGARVQTQGGASCRVLALQRDAVLPGALEGWGAVGKELRPHQRGVLILCWPWLLVAVLITQRSICLQESFFCSENVTHVPYHGDNKASFCFGRVLWAPFRQSRIIHIAIECVAVTYSFFPLRWQRRIVASLENAGCD